MLKLGELASFLYDKLLKVGVLLTKTEVLPTKVEVLPTKS